MRRPRAQYRAAVRPDGPPPTIADVVGRGRRVLGQVDADIETHSADSLPCSPTRSEQLATHELLGDLHGVERGALAQVVARRTQKARPLATVVVLADAPDVDGIARPRRRAASGSAAPRGRRRPRRPAPRQRARAPRRRSACGGVSTLTASLCAPKTGTRTHVAVTLSSGSAKILTVSSTIFCSSLVEPEGRKSSMCGSRLKAIWWG